MVMPIRVAADVTERAEVKLGNDSLPERFDPVFVKMFGNIISDKVNMFSCKSIRRLILYTQSKESEQWLW